PYLRRPPTSTLSPSTTLFRSFLAQVGIALRYGAAKGLPIASLYQAFAGSQPTKAALARAIELTNGLLGEARAIEVNVIAKRVSLDRKSTRLNSSHVAISYAVF